MVKSRYPTCFGVSLHGSNNSLLSYATHCVAISDVTVESALSDEETVSATLSDIRLEDTGGGAEKYEGVDLLSDIGGGDLNGRKPTDTVELKLQKSVFRNGRFENPWSTWENPTLGRVLKFLLFSKDHSNIPDKNELDRRLPILQPDFDLLAKPPENGIRTTWIGHATVLIQMDRVTILTDPIFSERCSASQYIGVKRYRSAACQVDELPEINAVLISHNHYDHLDLNSVRALNKRFGKSLRWYIPLGLKSWMHGVSCDNVVELDWWDEDVIPGVPDVKVAFVPSHHWTKRTLTNDYKVLWGGFCIIGPWHRFYFAGDTGYNDVLFKQIGQKYGPFHLAALPIGAYKPRWFLRPQHCDPEDAVLVHKDVKARQSVAIHWGTFNLTCECAGRVLEIQHNQLLQMDEYPEEK
ncbi:N-acyl-phosphatidylethanolamine-hydrolyzing phospholipase D [Lamellibrachia satsuma]|nr:N-acyl-phosphatidylethanolamine-hydrolyzing phospholipase D [Lamellibrachia satsuma]